MKCSFEVYSLVYKGEEVGCRINLMVDNEAYCALDFRDSAQDFPPVMGVLEVREVTDGYLLTEDEINGKVDVLDASENILAENFIEDRISMGTSPELGEFFYLCISNYIQRHEAVDFNLEFKNAYLAFRYKGTKYIIRYDNTSAGHGKHLVTIKGEGTDTRLLTLELNEGTMTTKKGFLKDCSRTVKLLQKEVLK